MNTGIRDNLLNLVLMGILMSLFGPERCDAGINIPTSMMESGIQAVNLIIDPVDSNKLYCLATEQYWGVSDKTNLFLPGRSTNGGETWQPMFDGINPQDLQRDTTRWDTLASTSTVPQIIYLATQPVNDMTHTIFYRLSTDTCQWSRVPDGDLEAIGPLAVKPDDPNVLVAGVGVNSPRIYRSGDGGHTWNLVWTLSTPEHLIFSPADPNIVFAGCIHGEDNRALRSIDAGLTWEDITGQGAYFGYGVLWVAPHPTDPDIIYTSNSCYMHEYVFSKTTDGGITWTDFGPEVKKTDGHSIFVNPTNPDNIICRLDPYNTIIATFDGGATWQDSIQGLSYTIDRNDHLNMVISPTEPTVIYSAGDGLLRSNDNGNSFEPISHCILNDSALSTYVNPHNPQQIFISIFQVGLFKSDDFGGHWHSVTSGILSIRVIHEIFWSSAQTNVMYLISGAYNGGGILYKSTDSGEHWTAVHPEKTMKYIRTSSSHGNTVYAVQVLQFGDPNSSVVGRREAVLKSTDGGETWTEIIVPGLVVMSGFEEMPGHPNELVGIGTLIEDETDQIRHFFRSTDGGGTWVVSDFEPELSCTVFDGFSVNNQSPGEILTADGYTLLLSRDSGTTWEIIQERMEYYDHRDAYFDLI